MKTPSLRSLTRGKLRAAFVCFAIMFGASAAAVSGATLTFAVGATNGVTNSQVVVPIRVSNFANISSFQFSFHWDTNVASFVGVEQFGLAGMTNSDFGVFPNGTVTVAWVEPSASAANLPDGSTVFGVKLQLAGRPAIACPVTIDSVPTALLAGDENLTAVPVTSVNSILSIDRTLIVAGSPDKTVECGSAWSFDPPVATDSCGGLPVTTNVLSTVTNLTSCGFIATRVWEIVDQCNNRTNCAQTVTANDTTPPTPIPSANKIIEYGQAWSFDAPAGTDICSGNVSIRVSSGFTNAGPCGPTYTATRFWELMDACGNKTNCSQTVTVRDTAPPSITPAADKNVNCLLPWTFDEPTAFDLANGVVSPAILSTVTNGTCATGFTATRTWRATDSCGNSSTTMQRVYGRAIVTVSGTVFIPTNYPPTMSEKRLAGTSLIGPSNCSATATSDGSYNLVFDAANNVAVNPFAPNAANPADGVTSLDISFIRRHILNVASLDSPYKILAADVDGSSSVSTLDLSFIRRLVLGTTNRFPVGLWRFVPSGYVFTNVLAPWGAPTNRFYATVGGDITGQDFVALKVGDVNNSWLPLVGLAGDSGKAKSDGNPDEENALKGDGVSAAGDPVIFAMPATNGAPGAEVVVPVRTSNFTGVGTLQFSFHWNTNVVTFLNIEPVFGLAGMTVGGNFNLGMSNSGTLAVSWDDTTGGTTTLPDGTSIFSIRFRISGAPSNTSSLTINGTPTAYEVTDGFQTLPSTSVPGQIYIDQPNRAPALANIPNQAVDEQSVLSLTAGATDADGSAQSLSYSLDSGFPTGAAINSASGVFSWTPTEAQGPGVYPITVRVSDNGLPPLSDTRTFTVTVVEVNNAPSALADAYNLNEDGTLNQNAPGVLANDADPDGSPLTAVLVASPTHGTLSLNNNGSFTYTPSLNYNGPDAFTYRASDGSLTSGITTVTLTVAPVNDTPVAANDAYTTAEDTTLNVAAPGVLANDTDADGNPLSAVLVSTVTRGTLSLSANGGFNYTPSSNYAGADSFTYRATDGSSTSGVTTVSITITPVNDIPVAANDTQYFTLEDTRLNVAAAGGVLTNDIDADGSALTALLVSTTTNGVLVLTNNGGFTYSPNTNANGVDHFTYRATDGVSTSALATVTLTVQPVNDGPAAIVESYVVAEDSVLSLAAPGVLSNDSDVDGDALRAVLVSGVANGTLNLNTNGSFTYTPNANYSGSDSFTYRASDGSFNSPVTTVNITVTPINDAPVAGNDGPYFTPEDTRLNVAASNGVLANDSDADEDSLTVSLVDTTANGTLNLTNNGGFSYLPNANFNGTDQFTYRVSDGTAISTLATVTLIVQSGNDAPVAVGESHVVAEDAVLTVGAPGVLSNDADADGDVLRAVLVSGPAHAGLNLNTNGSFTYTPNANYSGPDSFTYRATDGTLNSAVTTVSITVTAINDVPVAVNDSQYFTLEDTRLNIAATSGVLTNDTDGDGESLTALLLDTTTNGVLSLTNNGGFTYLPNTNFNGIDHFTYRVTDGVSTSALATVTLTVQAVNDLPTAAGESYFVAEDSVLTISVPGVLSNDNDQDGDALRALLVNGAVNGTLTLNTNGSFVYTPNPNYAGADSFTYRVTDGNATSSVATVTINVTAVNDTPVAANDAFAIGEDIVLTIPAPGVLSNDTDAEGTLLSAILVSGVSHGTLNLNGNGSFTYTPSANYNGADSFTYRSTDGQATSGVATVTITITSVNDVPVAVNDAYTVTEDATLTVGGNGVLANDTDLDGTTLTASLVNGPSNGVLTFNPNGSFSYIPALNFYGSDFFTYRASDGTANSGVATVAITVSPVNDAPVLASIGAREVVVGNPLSFTASATDNDEPPQSLTFSLEGGPADASINPITGLFTWTPGDAEASTTNYVTIRVTDNGSPALSAAETIALVVYATPTISIADTSLPGGTDGLLVAEFTLSLSAPVTRPVSVDFVTAAGSALPGDDYAHTNGTVIFPPGTTNAIIEVTVAGKSTVYTNRNFAVTLSNATNGIIANGTGVGTIEANAAPGFYIDDVTVAEANGGTGAPKANAVFTVTLLGGSERLVTVSYAALPGSALSRKDFKPKKGTLKFLPGVTTQTIVVPITGETMSESNETFVVNLNRPVNAVIIHGQGRATILDDDALPAVSLTDMEMVEPNAGASAVSFLVRLSARSGRSVLVDFATADNTAFANNDYVPTSGTLVFPPGITQQRVYVNVIGDTKSENDETFQLNLGNVVNATMGNGHAFGRIRDGDKVPLVSVSDAVVDSAVTTATFTVFLTAPSEKTITVNVATAQNTAQAGIDYTAVNAALTFEPGVTEKTVSVLLLQNSSAVTSRSFYLTLVGVVNTVMDDRLGVCTIPTP
jgi:VCBS repeat-containing protein